MSNRLELSVALCTYNGAAFLRQQLESIEGQTRKPDELIVCDDHSRDNSLRIVEEFARNASFPVRIERNEKNLGSTGNFEKAIGLCRGETIALSDQDDVWRPRKLERLEAVLEADPEAGYAFSDADLVDEHLQPVGCRLWDSHGFQGELKERFLRGEQFRCLTRRFIVTGATMAFRAGVGEMAMPFPGRQGYWIHDGWIALLASAVGRRGIAVDEALISYRLHANQQLGAADRPPQRQSLWEMYRELRASHQSLYVIWEKQSRQALALKGVLQQLQESHDSPILAQDLVFLQEFETHFNNRRKIMASPKAWRLGLILREAVSGKYAKFANSWRTVFRDLLL